MPQETCRCLTPRDWLIHAHECGLLDDRESQPAVLLQAMKKPMLSRNYRGEALGRQALSWSQLS